MSRVLAVSSIALALLVSVVLAVDVPLPRDRFADNSNFGGVEVESVQDGAGDTLTVFVLPHSHDDVGWVRTPTEYYDDFVYHIYTTVVEEMQLNPTRKFQCVEQYYFQRWWEQADIEQRLAVREFVAAGRFEFVVGGWSMPDEATTDYPSVIECMTVGHEFIYDTFGVIPRYGFQVDPFGASAAFAAYSAMMGFNAHIIDRIDYWVKEGMQNTKNLEFIWTPTNLLPDAKIFTHVMDQFMYCVPFIPGKVQLEYLCSNHTSTDCPGGNFLWDGDDSEPAPYWQNNPPYPMVNHTSVDFYAHYMVNNTRLRSQWFKTNKLLWPFGCDFQWFNATRMYESMDQIIEYVNANNGPGAAFEGVTMQYSVMSEYFDAIHGENVEWGEQTNRDFMPYTSGGQYPKTWSGYYTSHGQLKGHARKSAAFLRSVDQLYSLAQMEGKQWSPQSWANLTLLRQAVGILQHHDAVTGTEGPGSSPETTPGQIGNIVDNYDRILNEAVSSAQFVADEALSHHLRVLTGRDYQYAAPSFINQADATARLAAGDTVTVVAYNPLAWKRSRWVQMPVPCSSAVVLDAQGREIPSSVTPTAPMTSVCSKPGVCTAEGHGNDLYEAQPYILHFQAVLPPLGHAGFLIAPGNLPAPQPTTMQTPTVEVGNAHFVLEFSSATGLLTSITSCLSAETQDDSNVCTERGAVAGVKHMVSQELMFYESYSDTNTGSVSGSYIFHPVGPATAAGTPTIQVVAAKHVVEVWQNWGEGLNTVMRLYQDPSPEAAGFIEMDYGLGPLTGNHEIITRITTTLATTGADGHPAWFGDSNGHFLVQRLSNATSQPDLPDASYAISANYAPMVRRAKIQDMAAATSLVAMSSRTHGASSQSSGELEVMLHRRELQDDGLGACFHPDEQGKVTRPDGCPANRVPLNVTVRIYPRLWVSLGSDDATSKLTPGQTQALNNPVQLFFGDTMANSPAHAVSWLQQFVSEPGQALAEELPSNLHLLTVQPRTPTPSGDVVVRLQHLGDEPTDAPVQISPTTLFSYATATSMSERSLNVVWSLTDLVRTAWSVADEAQAAAPAGDMLAAGHIRTFLVSFPNTAPSTLTPFNGWLAWCIVVGIVSLVLVVGIWKFHTRKQKPKTTFMQEPLVGTSVRQYGSTNQ